MKTCKNCKKSYVYKIKKDYTGKDPNYCPVCKVERDKKDEHEKRHMKIRGIEN